MLNEKKGVPKLWQEVNVKVDIVTCDDIKIYYTGKFQDFTARYIITLERPYELAPGQRYCSCQFYVPAQVKNMAAPTRLHKVSTKTYF